MPLEPAELGSSDQDGRPGVAPGTNLRGRDWRSKRIGWAGEVEMSRSWELVHGIQIQAGGGRTVGKIPDQALGGLPRSTGL